MTERPRILVTQRVHADVASRLAGLGELDLHEGPEPLDPHALAHRLAGATAMIGFMTDRIDRRALRHAARLRVVAAALKGWDGYDAAACAEAGAWLTIVPDLLTEPTAELAIGLSIALGRRVREGDARVRDGRFAGWRPVLYGSGLAGSTVAILGMGRVGRAIAARLAGFGCAAVLGVDRPGIAMPEGIVPATLDDALARADRIFVALPLDGSTRHLVDASAIERSRHGTLWINVGRGSVVDEAAMAMALASGWAGGYAADVFGFEDASLEDRPRRIDPLLLAHPRTVFTPHLGSAVTEVRRAIEHRAVDNVEAVLHGRVPPDAVNLPRRSGPTA
ncbi:MAG: NAD(P)-dependent oxidoreductase [Burkholderiales bacterium]|jgi:phosphonate dehydrogenase